MPTILDGTVNDELQTAEIVSTASNQSSARTNVPALNDPLGLFGDGEQAEAEPEAKEDNPPQEPQEPPASEQASSSSARADAPAAGENQDLQLANVAGRLAQRRRQSVSVGLSSAMRASTMWRVRTLAGRPRQYVAVGISAAWQVRTLAGRPRRR